MRQLSLIPQTYKYIFDTSSVLSQKENEPHRRNIYKMLWDNIDALVRDGVIVICSEIFDEIKDDWVKDWVLKNNCRVLGINDNIQLNVIEVLSKTPQLIDFKKLKSSGDAFLIATAMEFDLIVVTEENPDKPTKIPKACETLGVKCTNILGLCELERWYF